LHDLDVPGTGDSHVFNADHPLGAGSSWLSFYGLSRPVANLNRITVDGSNNATNYLRVTVHQHGPHVQAAVPAVNGARTAVALASLRGKAVS